MQSLLNRGFPQDFERLASLPRLKSDDIIEPQLDVFGHDLRVFGITPHDVYFEHSQKRHQMNSVPNHQIRGDPNAVLNRDALPGEERAWLR